MSGSAKQAHRRFARSGRRQFDGLPPVGRAFVSGDGGGALRIPKFVQRSLEVVGRVQIVLKQKLHGAFARLAAFSHSATTMPEKESARNEKLWTARNQRCGVGTGTAPAPDIRFMTSSCISAM